MFLRLHLTSTGLLLFVLVLLLLLLGSRLCLSRFQRFFHVFGGFIRLAVVVHGYLRFVFFRHSYDLFFAAILALVRIPFIEAWAVLILVHANVCVERTRIRTAHVFINGILTRSRKPAKKRWLP